MIDSVQSLLSNHFKLAVELPLKAIVRGHSYATVPVSWTNRATGESTLSLQEMGSYCAFIVLYVFLESYLSLGDFHAADNVPRSARVRSRPWQAEHPGSD